MIVVPAIHPAHDVIVRLDDLVPGLVHRVAPDAVFTGAGGKAVNVALAIAAMAVPVRLVAFGDAALLASLRAHAARRPVLELIGFAAASPTRTDIALVDAGDRLTVINGTADDPDGLLVDELVAASVDGLSAGDVVVLAGSTPDGTGETHAALARTARDRGASVIVDASGAALTTLLGTRPEAVKISAAEAAGLLGGASVAGAAPDAGRPASLDPVHILGITDGAAGLRAWLPDGRAVRVSPPEDLDIVASLGAGDAVTAGLAIALARGEDPLEGFVLGTAMAASTLDHLDPSVDPAAVDRLRPRVRVIPIADRREE